MSEESPKMPVPELAADAHPVTRVFVETLWSAMPTAEAMNITDLRTTLRTVDHRAKAVHGTSGDNAVSAECIAGEITGLFGFAVKQWGDSLTDLAKLCGEFHLKIRGMLFTTPASATQQQR